MKHNHVSFTLAGVDLTDHSQKVLNNFATGVGRIFNATQAASLLNVTQDGLHGIIAGLQNPADHEAVIEHSLSGPLVLIGMHTQNAVAACEEGAFREIASVLKSGFRAVGLAHVPA